MSTSNADDLTGKQLTIQITRMAYGGDGIGHHEGKVVFVPYAAIGDTVEVIITKDQKRYAQGEINSIIEKSPERVEPRCPVFGQCGGCHWQHLSYEEQLKQKEEIFRSTLVHVGKIVDPTVNTIIPAQEIWNYRHRIQLKVSQQGEAGFHATGTHDVVAIEQCDIAHPALNQFLAQGKLPTDDFELMYDAQNQQVHCERDRKDHRLFQQAHTGQNRRLLEQVVLLCDPKPDQTILELYAGDGNFTLTLAPQVERLLMVEKNAEAVGRAERMAHEQGLKTIEFRVGTAEWGLKKMLRNKERPHTLLVDPPRDGLRHILDLISLLGPHQIIYVSCNPVSLARDLKFLLQKGYRLDTAQPIDMFPQTYHIESVVKLVHH